MREYLKREFSPEHGARKIHSIFPNPCRAKYEALGLLSLIHNGEASWDDVELYFMDCFTDQRVSLMTFANSCSNLTVRAVLEEYAKTGGAVPMTPNHREENWEGLLNQLQDHVDFSLKMDSWISNSTNFVPGCGVLATNRTSTRSWLNILRNQYPLRLKLLGSVLLCQREECWQILNIIAENGCNQHFGV